MINYSPHTWENKAERIETAKNHTKEMSVIYAKEILDCVNHSKIYTETVRNKAGRDAKSAEVVLDNLDSVSAIYKYKQDNRICVLNFSSYLEPGGKFLNGSIAQEESLCHDSFLYNVLSRLQGAFYSVNEKNKNKGLYRNRAIYSSDIMFCKNGVPIRCDVLTCACPNKRAAQKFCHVSDSDNSKALRSRIQFLLDVAENQHVDTLILGAYGCGVFGQDATEVATIFKSLLESGSYGFSKIIYAIIEQGGDNFAKFREVMKTDKDSE